MLWNSYRLSIYDKRLVPEVPAKPALTAYFIRIIPPGRLIGIMQKDKIVMLSGLAIRPLVGGIWYRMEGLDYGYHIQNYRNISFSH